MPVSQVKRAKKFRLKRETQPDQVWRVVGRKVLMNGLSMMVVAAWNEATKEVKYFTVVGGRGRCVGCCGWGFVVGRWSIYFAWRNKWSD